MCPLWPAHLLLLYFFCLCPLWFLCTGVASAAAKATWDARFTWESVKIVAGDDQLIYFMTPNPDEIGFRPTELQVISSDCQIAGPSNEGNRTIYLNETEGKVPQNLSFWLTGRFLGHATFKVRALNSSDEKSQNDLVATAESEPALPISVIRAPRVVDKIFIVCVAVLVGLNYVNMGCSLDLDVVKATLKRPVAPGVGLISQFLFMPLMSFGLAHLIFTSPNMRLGLFTLGCSPGGGASNMWTYLLGGNLNLSITMTFISNVLAFAAMPAWLFSLGRQIFDSSQIKIPYVNIVSSLAVIVFPVAIGLLIQRYFPRLTSTCRRLLGPCCLFMILFIVIFGIFANLYMFSLFTWRVAVAGLCVPWLGYAFGALLAMIFRFPFADVVAIAVETGVQNTGIAIVLLGFSLPQPDADLTSVVPVAAAIMMPVPLLLLLLVFRINKWRKGKYSECKECDENGSGAPISYNSIKVVGGKETTPVVSKNGGDGKY